MCELGGGFLYAITPVCACMCVCFRLCVCLHLHGQVYFVAQGDALEIIHLQQTPPPNKKEPKRGETKKEKTRIEKCELRICF